ncbi:MAG: glycosyltransferase family 4 protein [Gemmatimonadota bacterium]|nr:glycosyltransferase family 4 protein [Gemmatimonadota bacterium]
MTGAEPVRVFMPCTGLGREQRGFEAFTRECASALAASPGLRVTVFGGGGPDMKPGERSIWTLPRSGSIARALGAVTPRDAYFFEQASFFPGFARVLTSGRPHVVYFGDVNVGNACWHWRRLTRQRYRLLYYNGGATTRPFTRCDLVQQVSPEHMDAAVARGESPDRMFLLPHAVAMRREFTPLAPDERARRRAALGVHPDATVVLSVGALNAQKRMAYVIDEVSAMPGAPHLLLVGAVTPETSEIRQRAVGRLGGRCTLLTLPRDQARRVYALADAFVLASLREGFGIVQVEALDAGLPCVVHDTPTSAYVLGDHGVRADLRNPGALAQALLHALREDTATARAARHASAYARFSWDRLGPMYADALVACADNRNPTEGGRA